MKRAKAVFVLVGLLAAFSTLAAGASASSGQVEHGSIVLPTGPYHAGPFVADACGPVSATAQFAARGGELFAYRFKVAPATRGKRFTITPDAPADLDIVFDAGPGTHVFEARSVDREHGVVPRRARYASVCMFAGGPTSFTYVAGR